MVSVPRFHQSLRPLWQIHPPVALIVSATRTVCLQTLIVAARPSQERLHLRDLFLEGRRYYVQPKQNGFRLTSDNKVIWGSKRQRTRMAAVIHGVFSGTGEDVTLIRLHARMSILYMFSALLIPAFVTSILVYMPWSKSVIGVLIALLFTLSWLGHRFDAAYQANEMVYFVQKALEDLPPGEASRLEAGNPTVTTTPASDEFREQWQKFYEEHSQEDA